MSLLCLACSNFRRSVREYAVLVFSLAFSILIFFNFQNVIYSDSLEVLRGMKKEYIDIVVEAFLVVFGIFLLFFIWYATNVFSEQRKREIGIYIFMGLDNAKIAKMYALEAFFIGMASWVTGVAAGVLFSKLFQMLLVWMSDIGVDIRFSFSIQPVLNTTIVFWLIYGIMILKGYWQVVRSSVANLLNSSKKHEMKKEPVLLTGIKSAAGIGVLTAGYIFAWDTGDISSLVKGLAAVICVIAGVYLLYGGMIPFAVRIMCGKKKFLYNRERVLWVNSLAYRIRKNYRMYAIVTVLMITSVTVLATAIAVKARYDKSEQFRQAYTYQVMSFGKELDADAIREGIEEENEVAYYDEVRLLALPEGYVETPYKGTYAVAPESDIIKAAEAAGLAWDYPALGQGETVRLSHVYLISLSSVAEDPGTAKIGGKEFQILSYEDTAYLGNLQDQISIYVICDEEYEKMTRDGSEMLTYNFKIRDTDNIEASADYIRSLAKEDAAGQYTVGCSINYPEDDEGSWIRIMYSLCVFLFATLILAAGSIIFLKVGNDAYQDRERFDILKKIGIADHVLKRSARNEIYFTYYCPFVFMAVSSVFSVRAIGNVMKEDLLWVNIISAVVILIVFTVICRLSVAEYGRRAGSVLMTGYKRS